MNLLRYLQEEQKQKQKQLQVCHQYLVITPADTKNWAKTKKQLYDLSTDYLSDKFIKFLEGNYKARGYHNIRLVKRIKTQFFWYRTAQFMLECVANDSDLIQSAINVLISSQDTIVKLTKYQIFLMMCHLFLGTFPDQLYGKQISFGKLMTIHNDEDQITFKTRTTLRLNKLKAIVRYFCLFTKRSRENDSMMEEIVAFQRFKLNDKDIRIPSDNIKFCQIQTKVGQFYLNQNESNAISINNIKDSQFPFPGFAVYDDVLDFQEQVFISHPQMLILKVIMHQPLQLYQSLIIHGAQKYSTLHQVNDYSNFNFMQKFRDESQISKAHNSKITSFIFINRARKNKAINIDFLTQMLKVYSGIKACKHMHNTKQKIISGYFNIGKNKKIQIDWDLKFLIDWVAASLANWNTFTFYTQTQNQGVNLKILTKQLKDFTIKDIISVVESYNQFKFQDKAKITLLRFFKQFAL